MPATDTYRFVAGDSPLLVSMPHDGTAIPAPLGARMSAAAHRLADTDWHLSRLYGFARELDASVLTPLQSRYVVDLNRPPDGAPLYPDAPNTGLCPTLTFDGEPLYRDGEAPDQYEIDDRRQRYWEPYHRRLGEALEALRARHGIAVLWDAHSIRSRVPRLFPGRLADFNLGTHSGASCAPALRRALTAVLASHHESTHVVDGRFTGGYITRHYADPERGIHAVQLEQAQCTYINECPPFAWDADRAMRVQPLLRRLLETLGEWALNPDRHAPCGRA